MTGHDMLVKAADSLDFDVQGAPKKRKRPNIMDDRSFTSLNFLDRYFEDDDDLSQYIDDSVETKAEINHTQSTDARTTINNEAAQNIVQEPDFEEVEKELHNIYTITGEGQVATIDALASNTTELVRIGDTIGKWLDWVQETQYREQAHERNQPDVYQGPTGVAVRDNSSNSGNTVDGEFEDLTDLGDSNSDRNSRRRRRVPRRRPGRLSRFKRGLRGKAGAIAALAIGGATLWGTYADEQGSKYHVGAEDDDTASTEEDTEQVEPNSEPVETAQRDTPDVESPSVLDSAIPTNAADVAATAGSAALLAPAAVATARETTGAMRAGTSLTKTTAGTALKAVAGKGNALLSVAGGGLEAYEVSQDESLTAEQKHKEYAKVAGSTAGAVGGYAAGAAIGTTAGAWLGGTLGGVVGSIVPVAGTAAGASAGAAGGAFLGNLIGGYIGSLLGSEAGEGITDYVYTKIDESEKEQALEDPPVVDVQPIVDALEENRRKEEQARDEEDKGYASPIWAYNSPMMPTTAPIKTPRSSWSSLRADGSVVPSGPGSKPGFIPSTSGAPSLISMSDEQRQIINEVTGGDEKASRFLTGVLNVENRGFGEVRTDKVSPVGAMGAYQIMPRTWKGLVDQGKASGDPRNFGDASRAVMSLYQELYKKYDGNEVAMVAHYNGGNKGNRAGLAGEGDMSLLPKETSDYLKYYYNGGAPNINKPDVEASVPSLLARDAEPVVDPVERSSFTQIERFNPIEYKQPQVIVEQAAPAEAPKAKTVATAQSKESSNSTMPKFMQAPAAPTLDDMPILIVNDGLQMLHFGGA